MTRGQPTVDRLAALEARAREIADRSIDARVCCDKYPACQTELWRVALAMDIAAALTAAASEARAAERKTALEIIADVRRRYAPATAAIAALDYAAHRIECALATPAQPEGK